MSWRSSLRDLGPASSPVPGLSDTRRALRGLSRDAGREFDREAKAIAYRVVLRAQGNTPVLTGRARRSIKVSVTYRGVAVRSGLEYFGQHEFGRRLWLRRGLPYPKPKGGGITVAKGRRSLVEVRQVPLPDGRVVNEARYLIPRRGLIVRAAAFFAPVLEHEVSSMVQRLTIRHGLN